MMLEFLGLTQTIKIPRIHENSRLLSKEEKLKYFDMLSLQDIQSLYNIYEQDFKLFSYQQSDNNFKYR